MSFRLYFFLKFFLLTFLFCLCIAKAQDKNDAYVNIFPDDIKVGAEQTEEYLPLLKGKNIGIVANHTTLIQKTHLVDSLLNLGIKIKKVYCPEHGFRGLADAGEHIKSAKDARTGLPIISLYGEKRKPAPKDLRGIDLVIFDIQDVGVRFYTYISTMSYMMEACAENNIPMLILDRPNPNGYYVDGPVLQKKYSSFVGLHSVPLVHGMTVGEYARMVNGEGWLKNGIKCNLTVIPCKNYDHNMRYQLPVRPSPNLPNMASVYLYPSIGLFEGTTLSLGRGTDYPFQLFGHPSFSDTLFAFTPQSTTGSKNPPFLNQKCYGYYLGNIAHTFVKNSRKIELSFIIKAYKDFPDKANFFNNYFNYLIGNNTVREMIIQNKSEDEIRATWMEEVKSFKNIRAKYLLYKDFTE